MSVKLNGNNTVVTHHLVGGQGQQAHMISGQSCDSQTADPESDLVSKFDNGQETAATHNLQSQGWAR